jgi:4a-hydroxytetrahydrobiopterin dehydratase
MNLLTDEEIRKALEKLPGWALHGREIRRTFAFPGFTEAMGFVVSVALLAEKANHHPDIDIRWNNVTLALSTHSAGGLTRRDTDLATAIGGIDRHGVKG